MILAATQQGYSRTLVLVASPKVSRKQKRASMKAPHESPASGTAGQQMELAVTQRQ